MRILRFVTFIAAALMPGVSLAPSKEVVNASLFLRVRFFVSVVLFIPLFFATLIQFFAGVRGYVGNKQPVALFSAIFCLAISLFSMYLFNDRFFEKIL